jgi:hypothetical protein
MELLASGTTGWDQELFVQPDNQGTTLPTTIKLCSFLLVKIYPWICLLCGVVKDEPSCRYVSLCGLFYGFSINAHNLCPGMQIV